MIPTLTILLWISIGAISYVYLWAYKRKTYWKEHNIVHIESPVLLGNFYKALTLREHFTDAFSRIYNHSKAKRQPFVGINVFHKPAILIKDPELVKRVLVKDFNYFSNRHSGFDPASDPVGAYNLFEINNPMWRKLRNKLTPVFTSGKMKQMFPILASVGKNFNKRVRQISKSKEEVDARSLVGAFSLDTIALVALATETHSVLMDKPSDFLVMLSQALTLNFWKKVSFNAMFFLPEVSNFLKLKTFSNQFDETVTKLFNEVYFSRLQSRQSRGDLIDALIAIKKEEENDTDSILNDEVLVAQAAAFLFAGYETSSTTTSFAILELAHHPEIQNRAREELRAELIKTGGKITYEMVAGGLPYLTQIIKETSRKFSSLPFLDRQCFVPAGEKGYSLEPYSSYRIPHGMPVFIPSYCFHRDPEFFPDPEKFDPDRFNPELNTYNEYTYLPFGIGPRNCIGERFGKTQVYVALIEILRSFKIVANEKTLKHVTFDCDTAVVRSEKPIYVDFIEDELSTKSQNN